MVRQLLPLAAAAVVVACLPALLAPINDGCNRCRGNLLSIPISIEQGEGSWHELEVQPNTRYAVKLDKFSGDSSLELFSLNPSSELKDLKCVADAGSSACTFRAQAHGLLGVYVEPKTRTADAVLELAERD